MGLLKEVIKTKGNTELLLIVHGFLDGHGLAIPLTMGGADAIGKIS